MIRQYELIERVRAYDPTVDEALINRAYVFSMKAHGTQKRASGDPYFSHPLEVAGILTDMRLDSDTIATALLHDTIEDTLATHDEIEQLFGTKIAELVDGVTKLSKIEIKTEQARQAENFRKLLLAMSNDIRVLLVKLADRLHNMRTLHFIKAPEKRKRIAAETMEIYAPLAARIGMQEIKDELEELAFRQIEPEAWEMLNDRLERLRAQSPDLVEETCAQIMAVLEGAGLAASVSGREKRAYSVWQKIQRTSRSFEQLSDVVAFRVIVKETADCYRALGILHGRWPMVPGRFKDYVSMPKRNGYRSIHSCVIGPGRRPIEIQIRSRSMHMQAEYGVAAHWRYKDRITDQVEGSQYQWLRELLEILENAASPEEFLENTKLAMFHDQVFAFTPKGDLISLPKGSSVVDFAYAVHTEVGDRCVGAKANGRVVPLRYPLANGDQIEILTSDGQEPSDNWEHFVITGKARAAIRRRLRARHRDRYAELGRGLLRRFCRRERIAFRERPLTRAARTLNYESADDMLAAVGEGLVGEKAVIMAAFPGIELGANRDERDAAPPIAAPLATHDPPNLPISGETDGMSLHLADCCLPVPGDRIIGVLEPKKGIMVHRIDCRTVPIDGPDSDRWVDLGWSEADGDGRLYLARVSISAINEKGALADIATLTSRYGANIANLRLINRERKLVEMEVDIEVRDVRHLARMVAALGTLGVVSTVERYTP